MSLSEMVGKGKMIPHYSAQAASWLDSYVTGIPFPLSSMPSTRKMFGSANASCFAIMADADECQGTCPILADECIIMGVITGCAQIKGGAFFGSEGENCNHFFTVKTGEESKDADGNPIAVNPDFLDVNEKDAAWPKTNVFLVNLDCPEYDADGVIVGIPLWLGAEACVDKFQPQGNMNVETNPATCYGVIAVPSADVPENAWLKLIIDANYGSGR